MIVPRLVAHSLEKNIVAVNIVSLYTRQFERNILTTLDEGSEIPVDTQSRLTSELDELYTKIIETKEDLDEGVVSETRAFYEDVYFSLESLQSLIVETRGYLSFQFCLADTQDEFENSSQLVSSILGRFTENLFLYENPELFQDLIDVFDLQYTIIETLNTCFEGRFSDLLSVELRAIMDSHQRYLESQKAILSVAAEAANIQDQATIEEQFIQLSTNEAANIPVFGSDIFFDSKYKPLQGISEKNENLEDQFVEISSSLDEIKKKYNLT
jgi:hypothetical protein